ncbi:GNAT family N-acetyltransferase [Streptomyces fuscigenes]|uniref:GNAT family N-acetyltransferase n=1 Tax=Streptomyces fuscigenes TaxID=1528880 RepID=UPI001F48404D|nr:GNAT family N-acetyltransferase [Streptomyces fuscigenes]MCF3962598.1 GNAT family N-acetyltransferase [Streptomyces fuscigenes]
MSRVPAGPSGGAPPALVPVVRAMTLEDCPAVARVRVDGWRFAYAGLMPAAHLAAMNVDADTRKRREQFLSGAGRVVNLVAERAGTVVGWGCYGPGRDEDVPEGSAELYALYLLPGHVASGVGRALTEALLSRAAADGHPRMHLWVVEGNSRARRFYERAGFVPDGAAEPYEVAGVEVPEVRYVRELSAAPAAAASRG